MVSPTRRSPRAASALAVVAALGLGAAWAGPARAQVIFNPYMPYNGDYYNYTTASQPVNLALPGAAREAAALNAAPPGGGLSRYNSFDRWLSDYESDISRGRRGGASSSTTPDRDDPSRYIPNREADRGFKEREERRDSEFTANETTRARIARERDRYFGAAVRERDPSRRAAYMKVVAQLSSDRKTAESMLRDIDEAEAERRRPAADRRPAAGAAAPVRSILSNPALGTRPGTVAPKPAATAPAAAPAAGAAPASRPATTAPARGAGVKLPDSRPPMPNEDRKPAGAGTPAPKPLPDTAPPPPR